MTPPIDTGARAGFFVPYRYRDTVDDRIAYPAVGRLLAWYEGEFAAVLDACDGLADSLNAIPEGPTTQGAPRWCQDWFPTLDAAVAYAMVRIRQPARIIEIGSGHSTRFLARAVADAGLSTQLTAIDPAPRAVLAGLSVEWVEAVVQEVDPVRFGELRSGDVLSIDSSHILMPGSDVDVLFNNILPILPTGTLVHIHDIMLPDPYPESWSWRGYNEQQGVAPLITSGGWRPLFASHYVTSRMADALAASVVGGLPGNPDAPAGSLWLERIG